MKIILEALLAYQLKKLLKHNNVTVIAVAGSVGKTSTKLAIAQVLKQSTKVCYQEGNYNVPLTVPLVFFEETVPVSLNNAFAWLAILARNQRKLHLKYPYDFVVVELGIDHPGEMRKLCELVRPQVGVLTAVSFEHMEFFESLDHVAIEELVIQEYVEKLFVCQNSVDKKYLDNYNNITTYGESCGDVSVVSKGYGKDLRHSITVKFDEHSFDAITGLVGKHNLTAAAAAVAVAKKLGVSVDKIKDGLIMLQPFAGRMNILQGIKDITIIDDTYNSSPEAVLRALDTLYEFDGSHKIAVLGSMNELGSFSEKSHAMAGEYCDPTKLYEVITIGEEAKKFLAPAAERRGCKVTSLTSPYEAGKYIADTVPVGAVVLFKGSQNGVFAEEAIKPLLKLDTDKSKLVRQSPFWLKKKRKSFNVQVQDQ